MSAENPVRIVWIDDEPLHEKDARSLESKRKYLIIEFTSSLEFEDFVEKLEESADLFLIDDKLRGRSVGVAIAGRIRQKFPETPMYLFTAYPEEYGISTELAEAAKSLGDDVFDLKEIQREGHNILYHDAVDYRRIRESRRASVDTIISLLKAPEDDRERIISALPESLKGGLLKRSGGNAIAFAKWAKRSFLELPGFVYNSLYSATKLGITEEAFQDLASEFENARYDGVFAETRPKLWWGSGLREAIFQRASEERPLDDTTDLRRLTPTLFSVDESGISKCSVCGEKYPDTVGINKEDEEDFRPVHYRCSKPHPTKTRVLYFEERRQF